MCLPLSFCLVIILSLLLAYLRFLCSSNVGKERWGLLVEWVKKAPFVRLNKLFEIDAIEWAHNIFYLIKTSKP